MTDERKLRRQLNPHALQAQAARRAAGTVYIEIGHRPFTPGIPTSERHPRDRVLNLCDYERREDACTNEYAWSIWETLHDDDDKGNDRNTWIGVGAIRVCDEHLDVELEERRQHARRWKPDAEIVEVRK